MKKIIPLALLGTILSMNFVSAGRDGAFDLWYLFVENVFGNLLLSGVGILAILFVIGMLSKMSPILMMYLTVLYAVAFGGGYVGALFAVPVFILTFLYFAQGVLNFVNSYR